MTKHLVILALAALSVAGSQNVLAATPAANEDDQTRHVFYALAFSSGGGNCGRLKSPARRSPSPTLDPSKPAAPRSRCRPPGHR